MNAKSGRNSDCTMPNAANTKPDARNPTRGGKPIRATNSPSSNAPAISMMPISQIHRMPNAIQPQRASSFVAAVQPRSGGTAPGTGTYDTDSSISEGIARADAGDTVNVEAGTYVESGLFTFIGATTDSMFRAFDARNGAVLWRRPLGFLRKATNRERGLILAECAKSDWSDASRSCVLKAKNLDALAGATPLAKWKFDGVLANADELLTDGQTVRVIVEGNYRAASSSDGTEQAAGGEAPDVFRAEIAWIADYAARGLACARKLV